MRGIILNSLLLLAFAVATWPAAAAEYAPITDAEKTLTQVAWQPEASAVVLFKRARLKMLDYPRDVSSFLEVQVRIKILREEGAEYGEAAIPHSGFLRLKSLEGRTVLPDGTVVPVADDSIFVQRASRSEGIFVTKIVFPSVEVGAILDYRYVLRWDSFYYLEPWVFDNQLPTLLSEITYEKPDNLGLLPWGKQTSDIEIQFEDTKSSRGVSLRVWMENLPGLPQEPFSFPDIDLSSRFMLVTQTVVVNGISVPLLDSWKAVCETFDVNFYGQARRRDRGTKKQAKQLIAGIQDRRQQAETIYRFVRDEILTEGSGWVYVQDGTSVDQVLEKRRGLDSEKALVLQVMLDAIGLDAQLLWAGDRNDGQIDTSVANPWWFERVLVTLTLDGQRIVLDPSDRRLAFGRIEPGFEGMPAVIVHRRKPEVIELPSSDAASSSRHANLVLAIDEEGRLAGTGELLLSGHHAWRRLDWGGDPQGTADAWREWLDDPFADFEISDLEVEESVEDTTVRVAWKLSQREEEVLGDEVSIEPSRPLGPMAQLFDETPELRETPVMFQFAQSDQVSLQLSWPEGWEIELRPRTTSLEHQDGALAYELRIDEQGRGLEYVRRFDLNSVTVLGRPRYVALRDQFAQANRHDSQSLVLVRQ